jgi:pilus assembly protein CpaF
MTSNKSHELVEQVRVACIEQGIKPDVSAVTEIVRQLLPTSSHGDLVTLIDVVLSEIFGLGPIEGLLLLPGLTDVLVNRFDQVWVDQGQGLRKTKVAWPSEQAARDFASHLAALGHRRLDDAHPFVDLQLENGIRFHAALPPLAVSGIAMSFRVPSNQQYTLKQLLALGAFSEPIYAKLTQIVAERKSFIISGGTGSGKTTLLAAMLSQVDQCHRIIVIEDSTELNINHPHVVKVQSRLANSEGFGQVTMTDLVRQTLRMRPDRIVVGEVRGSEISDLLLALNTGHNGSATTIHADDALSVPTRIEALGLLAGLPRQAIHAQMYCAFHFVIQMHDAQLQHRGVASIAKFIKLPDGTVTAEVILEDSVIEPKTTAVSRKSRMHAVA